MVDKNGTEIKIGDYIFYDSYRNESLIKFFGKVIKILDDSISCEIEIDNRSDIMSFSPTTCESKVEILSANDACLEILKHDNRKKITIVWPPHN